MKTDFSVQEVERFLSTRKKKEGERVFKALGKTQGFFQAINTPLGQEILSSVVERMEIILERIINEEADAKEKAEFRVLRNITSEWSDKINTFQKAAAEIRT